MVVTGQKSSVIKCRHCSYAKWVVGSKDNYICQAFPNIIGLVYGEETGSTDCIDLANKGGATPDILKSPERSSIVIRTFWNDSDPDAGAYWDVVTEPKPQPSEEVIKVMWIGYNEGYTVSLNSGSRYQFAISPNGNIISESPAYRRGALCKHQIAIANSYEARPKDPTVYVPF